MQAVFIEFRFGVKSLYGLADKRSDGHLDELDFCQRDHIFLRVRQMYDADDLVSITNGDNSD